MTKAKVVAIDTSKARSRIRFAIVVGFTLIVLMWALSVQCFAQDYKSMSVNQAFNGANGTAKRKASDGIVKAAEATGNFGAEGDLYMLGYWIPRMTQTDRTTLSSLGKYRAAFLKKFLSKKMSAAGRRGVIRKLLTPLTQIAKNKDFHPAVRVNAVTIMGMLYDSHAQKWPTPSPAAYNALKGILNDAANEDFLKVAAISGIANFAEVSRGGGSNSVPGQDLKTQLAAIIASTAPGQDKWSDDLNYWMKRRATQLLGHIGTGDTVKVTSAVMKGKDLKVERDDFWLRYDGLNSLRNLRFDTVQADQAPQMIDDVIDFVAYCMERESNWIKSKVDDLVYTNILWQDVDLNTTKRRRRGVGGGGGGGGGPRGGGDGGLGDGDLNNSGGGPRGGGGAGGGFDGGGGGGSEPVQVDSEHVELPVFMLNDSRARAKAVLLSARDFLQTKTTGIRTIADANIQKRIDDEIMPVISELLDETELGVIDYRKLKGEDPDVKDVTFRLEEIYLDAAENLRGLIAKDGKEAGADAAADVFK